MGLFKPAVKHEAKLRLAISGPSGSGKTYTSLALATALAGGKPVALVDTEHGSAAKYADTFSFDVLEMTPPFHPDRFGEAIREAAKAGYEVIILDSLTHAWSGSGGMLDLIDEIAKRKTSGNTFAAWKEGTPIQNRLIDSIVGADIHVIATMRSKQDFVQDKDDRGKTVVRKVGMAAQQRDGFEYEFDVVLDMDIDNNAVVAKTRAPALNGRVFSKPGKELAGLLLEWLKGAPPEPVVTETTKPPASATNGKQNGSGETGEGWGKPLWPNTAAAYAWAVESGACKNEHEARASLKKIVDTQFDGKLHTGNMAAVFEAFHERQTEKLHAQAQAAADDAPELDPDALEIPA